jgi:hypothetical protein
VSEEVLKFLSACMLLATTRSLGDVYLLLFPVLGSSFGLFEALRHFQVYGEIGVWAVCAHIFFALVMGALFYWARTYRRRVGYALALLVPVTLHLTYNALVVPYFFG